MDKAIQKELQERYKLLLKAYGEHSEYVQGFRACMQIVESEINRKNAEIERLKVAFDKQMSTSKHWKSRFDELAEENDWLNDTITTTKAEAIKEFAERVKKTNRSVAILRTSHIDQIAKEMGCGE